MAFMLKIFFYKNIELMMEFVARVDVFAVVFSKLILNLLTSCDFFLQVEGSNSLRH